MRFLLLLAAVALVPVAAQTASPSTASPYGDAGPYNAPPAPGETAHMPPSPPPIPIDGGLGLLALAGGALAVRKLRSSR